MITQIKGKRGQAIVELAIFGGLILVAFNMLLIYGQRLDNTQRLKMQAFRKALQMAFYRNSAVSYAIKQNTHQADLFSGSFGQPTALSASASVMWQKGVAGEKGSSDQQQFAFYQLNDSVIELKKMSTTVKSESGAETEDVMVPVSIWKEEAKLRTDSGLTVEKEEGAENIKNRRLAQLRETLNTKLHTRYDTTVYDPTVAHWTQAPNYIPVSADESSQGAYLSDTNRIEYSSTPGLPPPEKDRTWETSHD